MSCAACSMRVERAVSSLEGVESCSVNLLDGRMLVEGADDEKIIEAVRRAGYGASLYSEEKGSIDNNKSEYKPLIIRLCLSSILLILLMYISMGHLMWDFPLMDLLAHSPLRIALAQLILSLAVLIINKKFFISGTLSALRLSPNMDTLVAMGSGISFIYSATLTAFIPSAGNPHELLHGLYFESSAMIVTLITVGKLLEAIAKGRTTASIRSLMSLTPSVARVIRGGKEEIIPTDELSTGDTIIIYPGDRIPADATVMIGESSTDESALTGESMPVDKSRGDTVYGGSLNISGHLTCTVTAVRSESAVGRIIKAVEDATATKAPIAKMADRVSAVFVPAVLIISTITFISWMLINGDLPHALMRAITVLVISCPCALGLATPVAIMVASGIGARGGVLFKNAASLEALASVKTVALDKTGTITEGRPSITDIIPLGISEDVLINIAYSLERKSEHPVALAICSYAEAKGVIPYDVDSFEALFGIGVCATLSGEKLYGASYKFISENFSLTEEATKANERLSSEGKTTLFFTRGGTVLGIIAVADTVKPDSKEAIESLSRMGIRTVMLTGDSRLTAEAIASIASVDEVRAELMPEEKSSIIEELSKSGRCAMVGDGINDAPALTRATVGIAIGSGTDIAIESADVVLTRSSLLDVASAIRLSRETLKTIKENLFFAFIYNSIGIPLAAGAFIFILGWELEPMFGALAMSLSSFSVVMNALRLNLKPIFKKKEGEKAKINSHAPALTQNKDEITSKTENEIKEDAEPKIQTEEGSHAPTHTQNKDEITKNEAKEKETMTKTIKIEGMMCPHCEKRVKDTLLSLEFVESADVSHERGDAIITLKSDVETEIIAKAIEDAGYKVI